MKKRIRYQGFFIFLLLVGAILGAKVFWASYTNNFLDYFTDIFGMLLVILGFLLHVSSRGYKAEESFGGEKLLKDGPYALSRNPMYLGVFLVGMGVVLVVFKLWVFSVFLVVFLLFYYPEMQKEERALEHKFTDEFIKYKQRVPVFFPSLRVVTSKELKEYFPLKAQWFNREIVSAICVLVAIFLFEIIGEL